MRTPGAAAQDLISEAARQHPLVTKTGSIDAKWLNAGSNGPVSTLQPLFVTGRLSKHGRPPRVTALRG
jgi:hypothetical protein